MDATLEFLWERKQRGRVLSSLQSWDAALLKSGVESPAIMRLATEQQLMQWEEEAALIAQALRDCGRESLADDLTLLRAVERASVADYLANKIDGWTLILRGCNLYYDADSDLYYDDDEDEFSFWISLAEEADLYGDGIDGPSGFASRPFDEALRSALIEQGLITPDGQPTSNP